MSTFLTLFGAEQVKHLLQNELVSFPTAAWNKVKCKYMVLRRIEKLFPDDISKNIAQWLIRLKYHRSLKPLQDLFFRKLLSCCVVPLSQEEKEWRLPISLFQTFGGEYYLEVQRKNTKGYMNIYDAASKAKKAEIEGIHLQTLTKRAVLLLRSCNDDGGSFFYDIAQGKKCDFGGRYWIKTNKDETLVVGLCKQRLYVQQIPTFDSDVDEVMTADSIEYEGDIFFIRFTLNDMIMVGFSDGSVQLFTIDKSSDGQLKVGSLKAGPLYKDLIPKHPEISAHRIVDNADEYIICPGHLRRQEDPYFSCGIRVTADSTQQLFSTESIRVRDYLGEKTLLGVDREQCFVIENYAGERICTGDKWDKIAIEGDAHSRDMISYMAWGEKNSWVVAMLRVIRDEEGNGIGFEKKIMEEVVAVPGTMMINKQETFALLLMSEPATSRAIYDLAGNKIMTIDGIKGARIHPNGCSILCKKSDDTQKKIPLYHKEKKMHFKRKVQECKMSEYFALEAVCDNV